MLVCLEFLAKDGSQIWVRRQQLWDGEHPTITLSVGNYQKHSVPLFDVHTDGEKRYSLVRLIFSYVEGRAAVTQGELSPYRILVDMLCDG